MPRVSTKIACRASISTNRKFRAVHFRLTNYILDKGTVLTTVYLCDRLFPHAELYIQIPMTLKYTSEFAEKFIELKTQGLSDLEVAREFAIDVRTLYRWRSDPNKPEFQEAWEIGGQREEAWWENLGRRGTAGEVKGFVPVSYIYSMKARFGGKWLQDGKHNTLAITTKHENMSDKELNAQIKRMLDKELVINTVPLSGTTVPSNEYGLLEVDNDRLK